MIIVNICDLISLDDNFYQQVNFTTLSKHEWLTKIVALCKYLEEIFNKGKMLHATSFAFATLGEQGVLIILCKQKPQSAR